MRRLSEIASVLATGWRARNGGAAGDGDGDTGIGSAFLWELLDDDDARMRAAAAWALAGAVDVEGQWRMRLQTEPRKALAVACLFPPGNVSSTVLQAIAMALLHEATRRDAARALHAFVHRGGALGSAPVRKALVAAQRHEDARDDAAFALDKARAGGDDFADAIDELMATFDVRWDSAAAVEALLDQGAQLGAHAGGAVVEMLWLGDGDRRARVAARIVAQAVAAGSPVDVSALATLLSSKQAHNVEHGLVALGRAAELGADVSPLLPWLEKHRKDRRVGVATAAARAASHVSKGAKSSKRASAAARQPALRPVAKAAAAGDGKALQRLLSGAKARLHAGVLHDEAWDLPFDDARVVSALVDAAGSGDGVVRFAVVDALAQGGDALSRRGQRAAWAPLVPALLDALAYKGKPELAPGSGGWATPGLAESAARALTRAVEWSRDGDGVVELAAAALDRKAVQPASLAARALAEGLASSGRLARVDALLAHPNVVVRAGLLLGVARADVPFPASTTVRALRSCGDADVERYARCVVVDPGDAPAAIAARIESDDGRLRSRELERLARGPAAPSTSPAVVRALLAQLDQGGLAVTHALVRVAEAGGVLAGDVATVVDVWSAGRISDEMLTRLLRAARKQGAKLDGFHARMRERFRDPAGIDVLTPDDATGGPWEPAQLQALMAKLALPMDERHPATFADAVAACDAAAGVIGRAAAAGVALGD